MNKKMLIIAFGAILMLTSCNQTAQKKKVESTAENNVTEVSIGDNLTACQHQSKIFWKGSKPGGEHNGLIQLKQGGSFIVDDGKLTGGKFVIDMNSIVNFDVEDEDMNAKLVGHLKSSDFFHVDSFPEAIFVITKVDQIEEDGYNNHISGNLTMKEITHEISFKAKVHVKDNGMIDAKSEDIVLDRTKWNVNYGSKSVFKELKDKFIHDEFTLSIEAYSM